MVKMTKSKTFQAYLPNCHRTYSCIHCRAHLANHDELISKVNPAAGVDGGQAAGRELHGASRKGAGEDELPTAAKVFLMASSAAIYNCAQEAVPSEPLGRNPVMLHEFGEETVLCMGLASHHGRTVGLVRCGVSPWLIVPLGPDFRIKKRVWILPGWKSFQGSQGRAYLFNSVVNVGCGPAEERVLLTGLHAVADIYCENCKTTLGWKYEHAFESSQKYKEGKFIIELAHMIKDNGWE
ncbi:YPEL1 protein, partial [Atractosteus spatula]|nr:YPEL1 protein [Atractosteus spatula]